MDFVKNFKSLPFKLKSLLSLGLIIALVVALPLFIWAITNLNFNQRERAATGEPPQTLQINWTTSEVAITADEFYINSGDKTYYGDLENITIIPGVVDMGPGSERWANIEIQSTQHGDDLRMKIYFKSNGTTWNVDSVGVLNTNYSNQWITYDNDLIHTVLGHTYYHEGILYFVLTDPNTGQIVANVHAKNLRVQAFTSATPPPTACAPVPMTITSDDMSKEGRLNERIKYNISITHNDPNCLGAINVNLSSYAISGWLVEFEDNNFNIASNQTFNTSFYVTPTSGVGQDGLPITITASSMYPANLASLIFSHKVNAAITQVSCQQSFSDTFDGASQYGTPDPNLWEPTSLGHVYVRNDIDELVISNPINSDASYALRSLKAVKDGEDFQIEVDVNTFLTGLTNSNDLATAELKAYNSDSNYFTIRWVKWKDDSGQHSKINLWATTAGQTTQSQGIDVPFESTPKLKLVRTNGQKMIGYYDLRDGYVKLAEMSGVYAGSVRPTLFAYKRGVESSYVSFDNFKFGCITPTGDKNGDVNGDNKVNIIDVGIVIDHYGESVTPNTNGDLNGDGKVNMVDIGIIIDNYGI